MIKPIDLGGVYIYAAPLPDLTATPLPPIVLPITWPPAGPSEAEARATLDFAKQILDAGKRIGELESLLRRVLASADAHERYIAEDIINEIRRVLTP